MVKEQQPVHRVNLELTTRTCCQLIAAEKTVTLILFGISCAAFGDRESKGVGVIGQAYTIRNSYTTIGNHEFDFALKGGRLNKSADLGFRVGQHIIHNFIQRPFNRSQDIPMQSDGSVNEGQHCLTNIPHLLL